MQTFLCAVFISLGLSAPAWCQPRPLAGTTLVTTDTSVTSACIGANTINAPSTCLGGLQAGPTVVNQALTLPSFTPGVVTNKLYNVGGNLFFNGLALATGGSVGPGTATFIPIFTGANSIGNSVMSQAGTVLTLAGTLQATVFGASAFTAGGAGDESLTVRNTSAGVANRGVLFVGNDTAANLGALAAHSSTFTTLGPAIANGVKLDANGAGGLSLRASDAAGIIHFFTGTGTVERGQITAAGLFSWSTFGTHAFVAGGVGRELFLIQNPTAGAGNSGAITIRSDTVSSDLQSNSSTFTTVGASVQSGTLLVGDGSGGLSISAAHAAGAVRIYTGGGALRATYAANGDYNLGANLTDGTATPTISSGCGTAGPNVQGTSYAFRVSTGTATPQAQCVVALNRTYATAPVCVASFVNGSGGITLEVATSTTTMTLNALGGNFAVSTQFQVLCRGF